MTVAVTLPAADVGDFLTRMHHQGYKTHEPTPEDTR